MSGRTLVCLLVHAQARLLGLEGGPGRMAESWPCLWTQAALAPRLILRPHFSTCAVTPLKHAPPVLWPADRRNLWLGAGSAAGTAADAA